MNNVESQTFVIGLLTGALRIVLYIVVKHGMSDLATAIGQVLDIADKALKDPGK